MASSKDAIARGKRDRADPAKPGRSNPYDPEKQKSLHAGWDEGWDAADRDAIARDFQPRRIDRVEQSTEEGEEA